MYQSKHTCADAYVMYDSRIIKKEEPYSHYIFVGLFSIARMILRNSRKVIQIDIVKVFILEHLNKFGFVRLSIVYCNF